MNNRPSKAATKNPIPKYMTDSIIRLRLEPHRLHKYKLYKIGRRQCHAAAAYTTLGRF
jgi:hypothetical protein